MPTEDDELHAHCKRPVYNIRVNSTADVVVLDALNATVEQLCRVAEQEESAGSHEAAKAYHNAARITDENLRAALARYGKVHHTEEGEPVKGFS